MGLLRNHTGASGKPSKNGDIAGLLSEVAFRQVLERERALADRHDRFFSLLLFDLSARNATDEAPQVLADIIVDRLRKTDIAGWFDAHSIGIILPYTVPSGAKKVADDMRAKMAEEGLTPPCEVHTYPPDTEPETPTSSSEKPAQDEQGELFDRAELSATENQPKNGTDEAPFRTDPRLGEILAPRYPFWKRLVDVLIALIAIVLLAPLMLVIMLLIKTVSPGPALFKQMRIGHLQQDFICWKFRTMELEADPRIHRSHFTKLMRKDTSMIKLDNSGDPRLIPFGKLLRACGLDELPQLFNVLWGDMSIIGPRPCIEYEFN